MPISDSVRIGDVERDRAVAELGDQFAAGRLNREEFDERAEQALRARFDADLVPLFADLPRPTQALQPVSGPTLRLVSGPPPVVFWLVPALLVAAVVGGIVFHAPFLLWLLVWFVVIGKITGHKHRHRLSQRARR